MEAGRRRDGTKAEPESGAHFRRCCPRSSDCNPAPPGGELDPESARNLCISRIFATFLFLSSGRGTEMQIPKSAPLT